MLFTDRLTLKKYLLSPRERAAFLTDVQTYTGEMYKKILLGRSKKFVALNIPISELTQTPNNERPNEANLLRVKSAVAVNGM